MATKPVVIRLSAENADRVKRELKDLGSDGQRALTRIERAGKPASRGLQAVNTAALEADRGLARVAERAGVFARVARSIGPIGIAVGVTTGAITALGFAARNAASEIAAIGDAADRVGVDAGTFEELRAALFQIGQGDKANSLETAVAALNKRIGEARAGVTEATRIFKALNIELENPEGPRTFEAVLADIADRFKEMDAAQRLALGQKLGEEAFRALIPVLERGSEGMRELAAEARQVGLTFGSETIRRAQELNLAFDKQAAIIGVQLKTAFLEAAPAVEVLTRNIAEAAPVIVAFVSTVAGGIAALGQLFGLTEEPLRLQLADKVAELKRVQSEIAAIAGLPDVTGTGGLGSETGDQTPDALALTQARGRESDLKPLRDREAKLLAETRALHELLEARKAAAEALANAGNQPGLPSLPGLDLSTGGGGADAKAFDTAVERIRAEIQQQEFKRQAIELTTKESTRLRAETLLLAAAEKQFGAITDQTQIQIHVLAEELGYQAERTEILAAAEKRWEEATKRRAKAQEEAAQVTIQAIENTGDVIQQVFADTGNAWRALLSIALQAAVGAGPFGGIVNQLLGVVGGGVISAVAGLGSVYAPTTSPLPVPRPGGAFGADFTVSGGGGVDSRLLMMPVTPGERVRVDSQQRQVEGNAAPAVVIEQRWEINGSNEATVEAVLQRHRGDFARDAEAAAIRAVLRAKSGARGTLGRKL